MTKSRIPKLPPLLQRKISKTGQTRGADDDVIFQNRVNRNNTVLISFSHWATHPAIRKTAPSFEKGYIVLISPSAFFAPNMGESGIKELGLTLGENALVFYETREDWNKYNPKKYNWKFANNRSAPLGGEYVARVPATTANGDDSKKVNQGYATQSPKGAGIRLYEYASSEVITQCKLQLEAIPKELLTKITKPSALSA